MHEQYFGFSQRPFSICPQLEDFFPGRSHQQTVSAAAACIQRRNGPVIIIGSVGSGKSLTLQVIGRKYSDQFKVVSIECSRLEQRSELLQNILFGLDMPFRELSEGELRLSLIDFLKNGKSSDNGILLLVDEADRLSIELLDELRLITNVVKQGHSQVQLVLAGTQRLEESLNDPRLASFNQRVASRSYLQSFSRTEVESYIGAHIERVGGKADAIFEADAIEEIAKVSDGCPRLINQLCENSLATAAAERLDCVTLGVVQQAWAELQNLPMPAASSSLDFSQATDAVSEDADDALENVVEFGSLDDDRGASFAQTADGHAADQETPETPVEGSVATDPHDDDQPYWGPSRQQLADDIAAGQRSDGYSEASIDFQQRRSVDRQDFNDSHDGFEDEDQVTPWDGRLPTNLGVHRDSRNAESPESEIPMGAAYDIAGDPFAPQDDIETDYQFDRQDIRDPHRYVDPAVDSVVDSTDDSDDSVEPFDESESDHPPQRPTAMEESPSVSDPRIESLKREQAELLKQVYNTPKPIDQASSAESANDRDDINGLLGADPTTEAEADVQAAFEGLEMIDQARSRTDYAGAEESLTEASAEDSATLDAPAIDAPAMEPVIDPFAEDFEEEVMIHEAYSPFVAKQNQSSLAVTPDNLSHLVPIDEADTLEPDQSGHDDGEDAIDAEAGLEFAASHPADEPAMNDLDPSVLADQDDLEREPSMKPSMEPSMEAAGIDESPADVADGDDAAEGDELMEGAVATDRPGPQALPSHQQQTDNAENTDNAVQVENTEAVSRNRAFLNDLVDMPKTEGRFTFTAPPADANFVPIQSVPSEWTEDSTDDLTVPPGSSNANELEFDADLAELTQDFPFEDAPDETGGQTLSAYSEDPVADDPEPPQNIEQTTGDTFHPSANASTIPSTIPSAIPSADSFLPDVNVPPTDTLGTAFAGTQEAVNDIRGQADDIIKRLREEQSLTAQAEQSQSELSPVTNSDDDDDQSHQVLRELMAQQQYVRQAQNPPQADSTSVEYPITEHQDYRGNEDPNSAKDAGDDRDMLRVNTTQYSQTPAQPTLPPNPLTEATPSTGEAQRMDYGQLFDQLRNLPKQ